MSPENRSERSVGCMPADREPWRQEATAFSPPFCVKNNNMARLLGTIVGYIHTGASTRTVVGFGLAQMFARGAPLNHAV